MDPAARGLRVFFLFHHLTSPPALRLASSPVLRSFTGQPRKVCHRRRLCWYNLTHLLHIIYSWLYYTFVWWYSGYLLKPLAEGMEQPPSTDNYGTRSGYDPSVFVRLITEIPSLSWSISGCICVGDSPEVAGGTTSWSWVFSYLFYK